jgi:hypothetical protein
MEEEKGRERKSRYRERKDRERMLTYIERETD